MQVLGAPKLSNNNVRLLPLFGLFSNSTWRRRD